MLSLLNENKVVSVGKIIVVKYAGYSDPVSPLLTCPFPSPSALVEKQGSKKCCVLCVSIPGDVFCVSVYSTWIKMLHVHSRRPQILHGHQVLCFRVQPLFLSQSGR